MAAMILVAHAGADCLNDALMSWSDQVPVDILDGTKGMLQAYEQGWRKNLSPVLIHAHDDLILTEPNGMQRILAEFEDESVGLVGLLGGKQHGDPLIYRIPYDLRQLGRGDVVSNLEDAEVHGRRVTEPTDVCVLDGMLLAIRRSILERAGGWPVEECEYVGYDQWASLETRRQGYRVRVVPVKALHLGGRTSIRLDRADGSGKLHERSHRWLYERYAEWLPARVQ